MLLSSDSEKLFCKSVPVCVKDVFTNQSRTNHLFLTMGWHDASSGMYSKKVLLISLTDNDDPFFLYNLQLSEEDFQMLKNSQDLLINFSSFPQHVIDYIDKCLHEERNPQPKFLLLFTINDKLGNLASPSQLDIIETNQFKNLTHLSLKFVAATESAIRQYLASCFRNLKEENQQQKSRLSFLEQDSKNKLSSCEHALNTKVQELELLKKHMNVELSMKDSKHAVELQEEKDRLLSRLKEEESRFEKEKREKEHYLRKQIHQLEERVSCLDTLNKELQDKIYKNETTIRELHSNVLSTEEENRRLKIDCESYKEQKDHLRSQITEKSNHIIHLDKTISHLGLELQNKTQNIQRLDKQVEIGNKLKKSLENELERTRVFLENSERTRKKLEEEKLKLNETVTKLHQKVKAGLEKIKAKSEISSRLEKKIEEQERKLKQLEKETSEMNLLLDDKNKEVKKLNDTVNYLQDKVVEFEKELKSKERLEIYLRRQLTDRQICLPYTPPDNLVPSPSSIAEKELKKISSGQRSSSGNSPVLAVSNSTVPKTPARKVAVSNGKSSSTTSRYHQTDATDSAYCTPPTGYTDPFTPDNLFTNKNLNFDPSQFDVDPAAFSAAFGSGDGTPKHSTAKKQTNPIKSTVPKLTKKR